MRAWWWILITAHLVCGNPERFKDDYGNTINIETNQNSATEEDKAYPSFILSPKSIYTKIRSSEGDEREKKQMRFHSWGGKRYGDEEEEEVGDNGDTEESVLQEPGDEDLMTEVSLYPSANVSHLETDGHGVTFREAFTKRIKSSPAFSSWGGKRDPEMMNDLNKRSNFYSPIFQPNSLGSKLEQSRKRYPSFSSWAGKRATAFNSWGGKRDYYIETRNSRPKRDYLKAKIGFNDVTGNQFNLKNENIQDYTSLTSNSDSERNLNFEDHSFDINNNDDEHSLKAIPEDKEHHSPEERHFLPELGNPTVKRAAAFNSWGGKRIWENPVMVKKPLSFNSWAGKRAAAFNSWGGKRRAAFNSWGGKRRAAFNSWGGKRGAAFNSWGGKRAASFNSWGGKRDFDKGNEELTFEYPTWTINRDLYGVHVPVINSHDNNYKTKANEFLYKIDKPNQNQYYIFKHASDNDLDKVKEKFLKNVLFNSKQFTNVGAAVLNNHDKDNPKMSESLGISNGGLEKRIRPSFTSWAGKRSPLFSSWYGGKLPTMLLTNGKRRPAFSSWGGKRSEHNAAVQLNCSPENMGGEDTTLQKREEVQSEEVALPEGKTYTRKRRDVECNNEKNNSVLTVERDKRASGHFLKNRVFTRVMLQGGWPVAFQPMSHGKEFFAWGGKRSFDARLNLR